MLGNILLFQIHQKSVQLKKQDTKLKQSKKAELEAEKEFKHEEKISAAKTAGDIYRAALEAELGTIDLLGSPDIDNKTVKNMTE